jgi:hypothetical protein
MLTEDEQSGVKCRRCDYDFRVGQLQKENTCPVCDASQPIHIMSSMERFAQSRFNKSRKNDVRGHSAEAYRVRPPYA